MKNIDEVIKSKKSIILWGVGRNFEKNIDIIKKCITVKYVCDGDTKKHGKFFNEIKCISPTELKKDYFVVIMISDSEIVKDIVKVIEGTCEYCKLEDILEFCNIQEEEKIVEANKNMLSFDDSKWNNIMKKYIGLNVPSTTCNLSCPYCYIRQNSDFLKSPILPHLPRYIRLCLSQKRLGGQALVGLCGAGETLLGDKIIEVCVELLEEGHFLHIVTNGTVTSKIRELISKAGKYANHIFFKFSFHYGEFLKRNLLDVFAQNVKYVSGAGASFTVELTTDDNLINQIDNIKEYSLSKFGALPHITIARDETKPDLPIFTKLSDEEYYKIWSGFNSELFEVKWNYFGKHIKNCFAGERALYIELLNGNVMKCLKQPPIDNLYSFDRKVLEYTRVEDSCNLPYCYNNHAYLTLGISPLIETFSFAKVRDRITNDGKHWVKPEMYEFMNQKLYDNN